MDDLTGPNVQIILGVIEGQGFGYLHNPMFVTGSLNGHVLQTDSVGPSPSPNFSTNLIWQADKKGLRLMRSSNVPMKIECFTLNYQGRKERVGYILLSLRSLQIVPSGKDIIVHQSWHKLLGIKTEGKSLHPEILISFYVEDDSVKKNAPRAENLQSSTLTKIIPSATPSSDGQNSTIVPHLISEEGLIQIGPEQECGEMFLLSVLIGTVYNLDLLLPENVIFGKDSESFCFFYSIFGHTVQTKNFRCNLQHCFALNEKIVLRLRSSLTVLKMYFGEVHLINLRLLYGKNEMASANMDLKNLIISENMTEFANNMNSNVTQSSECFLYSSSTLEIPSSVNGRKPFIQMEINLKHLPTLNLMPATVSDKDDILIKDPTKNADLDTDLKENCGSLNICSSVTSTENQIVKSNVESPNVRLDRCSGDHTDDIDLDILISEILPHRQNKTSASLSSLKQQAVMDTNTVASQSENSILPKHLTLPVNPQRLIDQYEIVQGLNSNIKVYHNYCLHIQVESIIITEELGTSNIQLIFHHPWAEVDPTNSPEMTVAKSKIIPLQNIKCRVNYIATPDKINKLLFSWPPKVILYKCDSEKSSLPVSFTEIEINTGLLFSENKNECRYSAELISSTENKSYGVVNIHVFLENLGSIRNADPHIYGIKQSVFNEQIAYKLIEELEDWKDKQQVLFKEELTRREEARLAILSTEWTVRRTEQESKLARGIEQCRVLSVNLSKAMDDFRVKTVNYQEAEEKYNKLKNDLEKNYKQKFETLNDACRRIEEDANHKINVLENENGELIKKINDLENENTHLKESLKSQQNELFTLQKSNRVLDHTEPLLQKIKSIEDKLKTTTESKIFFKEEWAKAIREIHRLKADQQQSQLDLRQSRAEMPNLGLQDILKEEENQLQQDQLILNQIRADLDGLQSGYSMSSGNEKNFKTDHSHNLPDNTYDKQKYILDTRNDTRRIELDHKLKYLIEERNTLLHTGSYTDEDPVIMKINRRIHSAIYPSKDV